MGSLLRQCPGVEGKVCNRFLLAKDTDPHCLCTSCHGKTCSLDDRCEECHDWLDDRCPRVGEYMAKLSLQQEKKHERKAEASSTSSSFSGFSPAMHVPLCQLPSPAGSGAVMTTPSSSVCAVTYSVPTPVIFTASFIAPVDVTPVNPDRKRCHLESPEEHAKMFLAFTFSNNRTRSNGWKLELKRFNTSQCGNFFTYRIAPIWNRLPAEAVNSASVEQFKIELDKVIDTLI